jgi:hypothetical protein
LRVVVQHGHGDASRGVTPQQHLPCRIHAPGAPSSCHGAYKVLLRRFWSRPPRPRCLHDPRCTHCSTDSAEQMRYAFFDPLGPASPKLAGRRASHDDADSGSGRRAHGRTACRTGPGLPVTPATSLPGPARTVTAACCVSAGPRVGPPGRESVRRRRADSSPRPSDGPGCHGPSGIRSRPGRAGQP